MYIKKFEFSKIWFYFEVMIIRARCKFIKFWGAILSALLLCSCFETNNDTFRSKELVSGKGEKIYINTLNWGVTNDYQYTVISKDSNRLKERKDTIDGIKGLTPFIYKFKGDTLNLFFQNFNKIDIKENFNSIRLNYYPLKNRDYMELLHKAMIEEEEYHAVP